MDMSEWAKREIELACKRNRGNRLKEEFDDEFNYGCACYASALKALKSMLDDAHSGTSIMITKYILNRHGGSGIRASKVQRRGGLAQH